VLALIDDVFGAAEHRVAFVDCNVHDATSIRDELMSVVPVNVQPLVLDEVAREPSILKTYDLVFTTYYHIREVEDIWSEHAGRLIPLHHCPSRDSFIEVARIPQGTRICLTASNERTLNIVRGLGMTFHQSNVTECVSCDQEALKQSLAGAEVVIADSKAVPAVRQISRRAKLITIRFRVEDESLEVFKLAVNGLEKCSEEVAASEESS
jgi:hypothetical protein